MKVAVRTPGYLVKQATKDLENDGYKFAVFTKEEAAFGSLGNPEWQCDSIGEALDFIVELESRRLQLSVAPEFKDSVREWLAR